MPGERSEPLTQCGTRGFTSLDHSSWRPPIGIHYDDVAMVAALDCDLGELQKQGAGSKRSKTKKNGAGKQPKKWPLEKWWGGFQGRMEWGSRALGNRDLVADPRRPGMKEILNARIKRREPFRPFAPSVLEEAVGEYLSRLASSIYDDDLGG